MYKRQEKARLEVKDSRIVWIDTDEARQLSLCMDKIVNRLESCTAVLCYNDQVAFQLIRLLEERGIPVPGKLSVISIDDSDLALHLSLIHISVLPGRVMPRTSYMRIMFSGVISFVK